MRYCLYSLDNKLLICGNAVEKVNLFYPPDPSSIRHSTIGGNIACNAGGPRCLKYGVTGDYVLGLTVVLADGSILRTGGKVIKDVVGYNKLNISFLDGTIDIFCRFVIAVVFIGKSNPCSCISKYFHLLQSINISVMINRTVIHTAFAYSNNISSRIAAPVI